MERTKLKKIMKDLEGTLAAVSFAEEGEPAAARSLLREERRVLVGLKEGRIDSRTLRYALNTAKRINAHLDILYVTSEDSASARLTLAGFEAELEAAGISHRFLVRTGCLKQRIVEITNQEKELAFAVIESPRSLDADCNKRDRTLAELWQKLKCPLVVVMDGAGA